MMKKFLPDDHTIERKKLRPQQVEVLRWLDSLPKSAKVISIIAPTGSGKSLISRAIQLATNGAYLAPTNVLVDQYCKEFEAVTPIYGKANYKIEELEDHTKSELQDLASASALNRLTQGNGTFAFNPISFALHKKKMSDHGKVAMIADESHRLTSLISLQAANTVQAHPRVPLPAKIDEFTLIPWLKQMSRCVFGPEKDKILSILEVYDRQPEVMSYEVNASHTSVTFTPVLPPLHLLKRLFTGGPKFLLSATLPKRLIPYLVPGVNINDIHCLELESDFPVQNRMIKFRPVNFREDSETDWAPKVVPKLAELIKKHGTPNTLIHVPYRNAPLIAEELGKLLPGVPIVHYTNKNKREAIEYWKEHGGVLLGCGISEGVDFPGDICRLNIVPKIILSDLGAVAVRKRKSLEGGELMYYLTALVDLIQAFGRGVRSKDDWCHNYCLDPLFPKLLAEYHKDLPKSFLDAVDLSAD